MGMTLTKEEHDQFHRTAPTLAPRQHDALMKKMGITKEEDEEWHRTHLTLAQQREGAEARRAIRAGGWVPGLVREGGMASST